MKISHLTPSEEILMNVLWRLDSAYMREIIEQYPEPKPHPNTISTFLKILVEKEFLTTRKEGRVFQYTVAVPFDDYRIYLLKIFLEQYFNNDPAHLVQLLRDEKLYNDLEIKQHSGLEKNETPTEERQNEESDLSEFLNTITAPKKKKKDKKKGEKKKKKKKV